MTSAFFDMDGTLTKTNVLLPLVWYQRENLPSWRYRLWLTGLMVRLPVYFAADRFDRALFVRLFYRAYAGMDAEKVRRWHSEHFTMTLQPLVRQEALACLRQHQGQGHKVVLVTGGLDFVVEPLAQWLKANWLAAQLCERDGKFTGALATKPMVGDAKGQAVRDYALRHGIDLTKSFAYGDSVSDAKMLSQVGHPVAVNPDRRLLRLAQRNGWRIVWWR